MMLRLALVVLLLAIAGLDFAVATPDRPLAIIAVCLAAVLALTVALDAFRRGRGTAPPSP
jgi:hypothetical protein